MSHTYSTAKRALGGDVVMVAVRPARRAMALTSAHALDEALSQTISAKGRKMTGPDGRT